jgi:2'-5' RNA ligase
MQSEEKIRTFIAINISSELREAFRLFIGELIRIGGDVKWVKPESIHLTLRFLGNLAASKIQLVCDAVQKTCDGFSTVRLRTGAKGAFPNLKRPKVFWVGLAETDGEILADLQAKLEMVLAEMGFEKEGRGFHPHLTLGRVRSPKKIDEVTHKFMEYRFPEIEFMADQVLVMKSKLTPHGALYSVQKTVPLTR